MKYLIASLFLVLSACTEKTAPLAEAQKAASTAAILLNEKKYDLAEEQMLKATKLRPEVAEFFVGLGMAQAAQEKKEEATEKYEVALSILRKEEKQRHFDQAMILAYLGRIDEAREEIKKHKTQESIAELDVSIFLGDETEPFRIN